MKKFLIGIAMYIVFIILYFIQADFFGWFTIAGISPNIFIIFILFLGLFTDNLFSIIMALLTGITLDLIVGREACISPIIFSLVAIIAGYFDKNFSKDNKITIMVMVARNDYYLRNSELFFECSDYRKRCRNKSFC